MLRALEIFWLSLTIFCFVSAVYAMWIRASDQVLLLSLIALVAGYKYFIRRKQRRAAEHKK